jgi:hypothetical protein
MSAAVAGDVPCPEEEGDSSRLRGDVDGDGVVETIAVDRPTTGQTTIQVCGTQLVVTPHDVGDLNKPAEVYVIDVEGDRVVELLVGGPTGAARFSGSLLRLIGSELVDLRLSLTVLNGGRAGSSFGCVDVDADGHNELVTLTYVFDADTMEAATSVEWTRTVVFDGNLADGPTSTGTFDVQAQPNAVRALVNGTCGEDTLIEGG